MNIGFWNINGKKLGTPIRDFAIINQLDILILGESPYEPSELLLILNQYSSDYFYAPEIICKKIQFFIKFKPELFSLIEEKNRISVRRLFSAKHGVVTLIAVHYNSKVNWSNEDQAAQSLIYKNLIDSVEAREGHKRTIICGDFNMNPFDVGMVQSTGLHAVMEKKIAIKQSRIIDGDSYDFFYNPMWSFLGDLGKGEVSGSLYYSPAKPINYHWNLFDQVLIRPALINDFVDDELDIITKIGKIELLTKNHTIDTNYSDHLPIKFKINI